MNSARAHARVADALASAVTLLSTLLTVTGAQAQPGVCASSIDLGDEMARDRVPITGNRFDAAAFNALTQRARARSSPLHYRLVPRPAGQGRTNTLLETNPRRRPGLKVCAGHPVLLYLGSTAPALANMPADDLAGLSVAAARQKIRAAVPAGTRDADIPTVRLACGQAPPTDGPSQQHRVLTQWPAPAGHYALNVQSFSLPLGPQSPLLVVDCSGGTSPKPEPPTNDPPPPPVTVNSPLAPLAAVFGLGGLAAGAALSTLPRTRSGTPTQQPATRVALASPVFRVRVWPDPRSSASTAQVVAQRPPPLGPNDADPPHGPPPH